MAARYGGIKIGPNTDRWMQAEAATTAIHMIWCIFEIKKKTSGLIHSRIIDFIFYAAAIYMLLVHVSDVCTWKTHRIILIYMQPPGAAGGENVQKK